MNHCSQCGMAYTSNVHVCRVLLPQHPLSKLKCLIFRHTLDELGFCTRCLTFPRRKP